MSNKEKPGFISVTQKKFYDLIGPRDICVSSRNLNYSSFYTRSNREVGRAYASLDGDGCQIYKDNGSAQSDYYMSEWFFNNPSLVPEVKE